MAISIPEAINIFASQAVSQNLANNVFNRSPFLSALGLKGGGNNFIPSSPTIVGREMSGPEKQMLGGNTAYRFHWVTEAVGGSARYTYSGASVGPNAASIKDKTKAAAVNWAAFGTPLTLNNFDIGFVQDAVNKQEALQGLVELNTKSAMSDHMDFIADDLYQGTNTNQLGEIADQPSGLFQWVHNSNTVAGVNRALAANAAFRSQRSTANLQFNYQLIDDIFNKGVNDGAAGTTRPLNDFVGEKSYMIVTNNRAYSALKAEVMAKQLGRICQGNEMTKKGGWLGWEGEYLNINGVMVMSDPKCRDLTTPTNNPVFVLNIKDWMFQGAKNNFMRVRKAVSLPDALPATGQANTTNSEIFSQYRLVCENPGRQFMLTNVAA